MKKVRWVHEPIELFRRTAEKFATEIERLAPGEFEVEILTLSEFATQYNEGVAVSRNDFITLIREGKLEMCQVYTSKLAELNSDLRVLDMPYLFSSYVEAGNALAGQVGIDLLKGLFDGEDAVVRGLAYTFAGGYNMIPATKEIDTTDDLVGVSIRCDDNEIAKKTFEAIGATPVALEVEQIKQAVTDGTVAAADANYTQFFANEGDDVMKTLNDTRHSMNVAAIVCGKAFWKSLDKSSELRGKVADAALLTAEAEQEWSVDEMFDLEIKCTNEGITVNRMTTDERTAFMQATAGLYDTISLPAGVADRIRAYGTDAEE